MSRTSSSGGAAENAWTASRPLAVARTSKPSAASARDSTERSPVSSSQIPTRTPTAPDDGASRRSAPAAFRLRSGSRLYTPGAHGREPRRAGDRRGGLHRVPRRRPAPGGRPPAADLRSAALAPPLPRRDSRRCAATSPTCLASAARCAAATSSSISRRRRTWRGVRGRARRLRGAQRARDPQRARGRPSQRGRTRALRVDDLGLLRHRARACWRSRRRCARPRTCTPRPSSPASSTATATTSSTGSTTRSCASGSRTARGRARRRSCPRSSPARWPASRSPWRVTGSSRGASSTSRTSPRASSRALAPVAANRVYNLVGSEDVTVAEVAETVRELVGGVEITRVAGPRRGLRRRAGQRRAGAAGARVVPVDAVPRGRPAIRRMAPGPAGAARAVVAPRGGHAGAARADRRADGGARVGDRARIGADGADRRRHGPPRHVRRDAGAAAPAGAGDRVRVGRPARASAARGRAGPGSSPRSCRSWSPGRTGWTGSATTIPTCSPCWRSAAVLRRSRSTAPRA